MLLAKKVPQAHKVTQVLKVTLDIQGHRVLVANKVPQASKVLLVYKVPRV